jgi:hypothetical protein
LLHEAIDQFVGGGLGNLGGSGDHLGVDPDLTE